MNIYKEFKQQIIMAALTLCFFMLLPPSIAMANTPDAPADSFVPVTNITIETHAGQVNQPFTIEYTVYPENATNYDVIWRLQLNSPSFFSISDNIVNATQEGSVTVTATIEDGRGNEQDFTQSFTLNFSNSIVTAELEGLYYLFVGVEVNANVLLTLEGDRFVEDIFPSDFFVRGLPPGLTVSEVERVSDTQIRLSITGAPTWAVAGNFRISPQETIAPRNLVRATFPVGVVAYNFTRNFTVGESANIFPSIIYFDLNPDSSAHRNVTVTLNQRDREFVRLVYGTARLVEYDDFLQINDHTFTIFSSFLRRMQVGEWDLHFIMRAGDNPALRVVITDSTPPPVVLPGQPVRPGFPLPEVPIVPVGPPPSAPVRQPHPNEMFFFLSGGQAVDTQTLNFSHWPRVMPSVENGTASVTIRANALEHLAATAPTGGFELRTSLARLLVPLDVLDTAINLRSALIDHRLFTSDVDLRISLIDRSGGANLENLINIYPSASALSNLVEIRVELLDIAANNERVIFTAREFERPLESIYTIMPVGAHIRPAAVYFNPYTGWPEFAPNNSNGPNEVRVRSRFAGIHGIINNGTIFGDVPHEHWGFARAHAAAHSGLVVATGYLNPGVTMSRGEFVQLLSFALQLPRVNALGTGYADVSVESPFYDGMRRARAAGLLTFWPGTAFSPYEPITRQEMLAITGAVAWMNNPNHNVSAISLMGAFTDAMDVEMRYFTNVQAALNFGLFSGTPDLTFQPLGSVTRIEALSIVVQLSQLLGMMD